MSKMALMYQNNGPSGDDDEYLASMVLMDA